MQRFAADSAVVAEFLKILVLGDIMLIRLIRDKLGIIYTLFTDLITVFFRIFEEDAITCNKAYVSVSSVREYFNSYKYLQKSENIRIKIRNI